MTIRFLSSYKNHILQVVMVVISSACLIFSIASIAQQKQTPKLTNTARPTAKTTAASQSDKTNIAPQMVLVKGGQFMMGNYKREEADEQPEHKVNVSSFMMGKYEVTVGEFRKFMESHTLLLMQKSRVQVMFSMERILSTAKMELTGSAMYWVANVLMKKTTR